MNVCVFMKGPQKSRCLNFYALKKMFIFNNLKVLMIHELCIYIYIKKHVRNARFLVIP